MGTWLVRNETNLVDSKSGTAGRSEILESARSGDKVFQDKTETVSLLEYNANRYRNSTLSLKYSEKVLCYFVCHSKLMTAQSKKCHALRSASLPVSLSLLINYSLFVWFCEYLTEFINVNFCFESFGRHNFYVRVKNKL